MKDLLKKFKALHLSTQIMFLSFLIGTGFFVAFFIIPNKNYVVFAGYLFVLFAIIINTVSLAALLIQLVTNWKTAKITFIRILIVLSNIPIAALYLYHVLQNF